MTLKAYIWGLRFLALVFLSGLSLAIYHLDPASPGIKSKLIFYALTFLFLSCFFNLLFLALRRKSLRGELAIMAMGLSFRQGALAAIFFTGLLLLQSFRILVWWDGLLLLAGVFLLELYFLSRNR